MNRFINLTIFTFFILMALGACSPTTPDDADPTLSPSSSNPTKEIPPENGPSTQPLSTPTQNQDFRQYEIVTLLPKDAIPAIDDPEFLSAAQADAEYAPDELVLGVVFNGDARAYSVNLLSRHEIVNDTIGGIDIAVTW